MPYQVWKCSICDKECETKKEAELALQSFLEKIKPTVFKKEDLDLLR